MGGLVMIPVMIILTWKQMLMRYKQQNSFSLSLGRMRGEKHLSLYLFYLIPHES